MDSLTHFDPVHYRTPVEHGKARYKLACALKGTLPNNPETAPILIFGDNVHWRVIAFSTQHRTIYVMDPYGTRNSHTRFPQYMKAAVQRYSQMWHASGTLSAWDMRELQIGLQHQEDGHSCGPWSIWLVQQWLAYHGRHDNHTQTFENYLSETSLHGNRRPLPHAGIRLRELYRGLVSCT